MTIQPYLSFEGRAEEALGFYQKALGAKLEALMRFKDSPEACPEGMLPAGAEGKIMHMSFKIGDATIMASDGRCSGKPEFKGIALAYLASDVAGSERAFAALAEGGAVQMPLGKTFFSPSFGMVEDRFGVAWMVLAPMPA